MRLLRIFGLGLEFPGSGRQGRLAVARLNQRTHLVQGLAGEMNRVGAHISNQAHRALADINAFIQLLGDAHRPLRGKAQLPDGLLLQGGGNKRRGGLPFALLFGHGLHPQLAFCRLFKGAPDFRGARLGFNAELLYLFFGKLDQPGVEFARRMGQIGLDGPVFPGLKGLDLQLPLDDHPERGRLHAPGREALLYLFPQQRRQVKAHQIIQRAAGLLGVNQISGELAGMLDRVPHRAPGDFMKHHAMHGFLFQAALLLEQFIKMPGDGLALAVGVCGQIQGVGLFERLFDRGQRGRAFFNDLIAHGKAVLGVHRA